MMGTKIRRCVCVCVVLTKEKEENTSLFWTQSLLKLINNASTDKVGDLRGEPWAELLLVVRAEG